MGSKNDADYEVPPLDRVYDALDSYSTRRTDMSEYTDKLQKGDVVLLEFSVNRWVPTANDKKDKNDIKDKNSRPGWHKWNIDFKLLAVSVIYPGHEYMKDVDDDGEVADNDVPPFTG